MVGKDKGKQGKIREVARSKNWVFVQNMNLVRHLFFQQIN